MINLSQVKVNGVSQKSHENSQLKLLKNLTIILKLTKTL